MKKKIISYSKESAVTVIDKELEETKREIVKLSEIWKAKLKEEKNLPYYKKLFG